MKKAKKSPRKLNARQIEFAQRVASGETQTSAYRKVYDHPEWTDQCLAEKGSKLAADSRVSAEIARIRNRREVKKLLTLNDRLEILADIAQDKKAKPHEKARAIEVYSKISGDQAPERHDHTVAGPGGGPIPVTATVATRTMSRREKVEAMKAARAAARAEPAL